MIGSLPGVTVALRVAELCVTAVAARVVTAGGTISGASVVVELRVSPYTVQLAVVANALNFYSVCASNPVSARLIVSPVAKTLVQSVSVLALYSNA